MRPKIDPDKIKDPTQSAIAGMSALSRRRRYGFKCDAWTLRLQQAIDGQGKLSGKTFLELQCTSAQFPRPKYNCVIKIVAVDSAMHIGSSSEACCAVINQNGAPSDPDGAALDISMTMRLEAFDRLQAALASPTLQASIVVETHDAIADWNGEHPIICEQYEVLVSPKQEASSNARGAR